MCHFKIRRFNAAAAASTLLLSMCCFSAGAQMIISGTPPATATVGDPYSFVPVVENANQKELQFSYADLPSWSGSYRGSGAIIGTPTTPGVYSNIQIKAWDGVHFAETEPFTITVLGTGTSAPPPGGSATASLSWAKPTQNADGTPLKDLTGYIVRYGTSPSALTEEVPVSSPNSTSLEIEHLSPGNWFFAVAAVNSANTEGEFSFATSAAIP
jgi:hypothetical protein